jgi:hypothetical protein
MTRQNRTDPWGDLHAVPVRGMFTGNRGCLVDEDGQVVRHHRGSLWITCLTRYRGWQHPLDQPRTWTPVFFLDDAVALAAGHRPCGLCRRPDYLAYRAAVTEATGADSPVLAVELNRRLAAERHRHGRGLTRAADRILTNIEVDVLPTGAVVADTETRQSHLVTGNELRPFDVSAWGAPAAWPSRHNLKVLTPATSIAALRNGFEPRLHPTAS